MVMFSEPKDSQAGLMIQFANIISLFGFGKDACKVSHFCWLAHRAYGVYLLQIFYYHFDKTLPSIISEALHETSTDRFWRE